MMDIFGWAVVGLFGLCLAWIIAGCEISKSEHRASVMRACIEHKGNWDTKWRGSCKFPLNEAAKDVN